AWNSAEIKNCAQCQSNRLCNIIDGQMRPYVRVGLYQNTLFKAS
ncbi:15041_t:CDS:2, partial [Racocetra persica]